MAALARTAEMIAQVRQAGPPRSEFASRVVQPEPGRDGTYWGGDSAIPEALDEFANSIHCYSDPGEPRGERLGPSLVHAIAFRPLALDDVPGSYDGLRIADDVAVAIDPEHGPSEG